MNTLNPPYSWRRCAFISTISLFFLGIILRVNPPGGDEGVIVGAAFRILNGDLPYRDIFELSLPGSTYWLVFWFKLFGMYAWVSRASLLVTSVGIVLAIDWISCRVYRGRFDYLPAFFYMCTAFPDWSAISYHWDANFLTLVAIGFFLSRTPENERGRLAISGLFLGLAALCQQQKGFVCVLAGICVLLLEHFRSGCSMRALVVRILALVVPSALVVAALFGYFWWQGAFADIVYATMVFPFQSYSDVNDATYGYWFVERQIPSTMRFANLFPPLVAPILGYMLLLPYYLYLFVPVLVIVSLIICARNGALFKRISDSGILSLAILGFGLFVSEMHRKSLMYIVWGSPVLIVTFFLLWQTLWQKYKRWNTLFLSLMTASILIVGLQNAFVFSFCTHVQETRNGKIIRLQEDPILSTILKYSKNGEQALIYPFSTNYYFFAGLRNPTRISYFIYRYTTAEQYRETIDLMEKRNVKKVFVDATIDENLMKKLLPSYAPPPKSEQFMENYLSEKFIQIAFENGVKVLQRKE